LRRKLEEKAFAEGELYFNLRQYQSAVISFDNLLRDYPESPDAERVRYLIAKGLPAQRKQRGGEKTRPLHRNHHPLQRFFRKIPERQIFQRNQRNPPRRRTGN
jgi:outer membrane protein assembly factor BamD (BamD/ComL family)